MLTFVMVGIYSHTSAGSAMSAPPGCLHHMATRCMSLLLPCHDNAAEYVQKSGSEGVPPVCCGVSRAPAKHTATSSYQILIRICHTWSPSFSLCIGSPPLGVVTMAAAGKQDDVSVEQSTVLLWFPTEMPAIASGLHHMRTHVVSTQNRQTSDPPHCS